MIEFSNGMVIRYDGGLNWCIGEKKLNKVTGKTYIKDIAFYGTLTQCISRFIEKYGLNASMGEIDSLQSIMNNIEDFKIMVLEGIKGKL